jgi:hypothetical protein
MIHPDDQGEYDQMTNIYDGKYSAFEARLLLTVERLVRVLELTYCAVVRQGPHAP